MLKVLDDVEDTVVLQDSYNGGHHQQWRPVPIERGYYRMENQYTEKVMTVENNSMSNGAAVLQETYDDIDNQQWRLEKYLNARISDTVQ